MSKIKEIPVLDRPIERLINVGVDKLSNEELLAILIKTGTKKESSKELALKILKKVYNIQELKKITLEELNKIEGIGNIKAATILSAIELGSRINSNITSINNLKFNNPEIIFEYYKEKFKYLYQENFYCVYLDNNKKIIKDKQLFMGTINYSLVHPREVFKEAYLLSASAIICVHNHPSGEVIPSKQDIEITNKLKEIGNLLGIEICDHIIIGKDKYYSFYENGDL